MGWLGLFFRKYKTIITVILSAVILTFCVTLFVQNRMLTNSLVETNATLEIVKQDLITSNQNYITLKANIASAKEELFKLNNDLETQRITSNQIKQDLDRYKGRQSTVAAKPTLVEKKLNASYSEFLDRITK